MKRRETCRADRGAFWERRLISDRNGQGSGLRSIIAIISIGCRKKAVLIDLYEEKRDVSCRQGSLGRLAGQLAAIGRLDTLSMISMSDRKKAVPIDLYEEKIEMSCRQGSLKGIIGVKSRKEIKLQKRESTGGACPRLVGREGGQAGRFGRYGI